MKLIRLNFRSYINSVSLKVNTMVRNLIFLMLILSGVVAAQNEVDLTEHDTLIELNHFTDTTNFNLVLFENEEILVKTTIKILEKNVANWLSIHPHLKSDQHLLDTITRYYSDSMNFLPNYINNNIKLVERLEYRLADILDEGNCIIIIKSNKQIIKKIKKRTYSFVCGPLCGHGGRIFYFEEIEFFRVMDWIS